MALRITEYELKKILKKEIPERHAKRNPGEDELKRLARKIAEQYGLDFQEEWRPIPGRRYRVDCALPEIALACECDGWQFHARHKETWKKEKERDRQLVEAGWAVLRFPASEILRNPHTVTASLRKAIESRKPQNRVE